MKKVLLFCSMILSLGSTIGDASPSSQASEQYVSTLVNVNSSQCLAIGSASTEKGKAAIQWTCGSAGASGNPEQDWLFTQKAGGYEIMNINSGMCLAIAGGSKDNAAAAVQVPCDGSLEQTWILPDNTQHLVNARSNKCLAIGSADKTPGKPVIQWPCDSGSSGNPEQDWLKPGKFQSEGDEDSPSVSNNYDFRTFEDETLNTCPALSRCYGNAAVEDVASSEQKTRAIRLHDTDTESQARVMLLGNPIPAKTFDFDLLPQSATQSTIIAVHGTGADEKTGAWRFLIQPNGTIQVWDGKWTKLGTVAALDDSQHWSHITISASTNAATIETGGSRFTTTTKADTASNITSLEVASSGTTSTGTDTYIDGYLARPAIPDTNAEKVYEELVSTSKNAVQISISTQSSGRLLDVNDMEFADLTGIPVYNLAINSNALEVEEVHFEEIDLDSDYLADLHQKISGFASAGFPADYGQYRVLQVNVTVGTDTRKHSAVEFCWNASAKCLVFDPNIENLGSTITGIRERKAAGYAPTTSSVLSDLPESYESYESYESASKSARKGTCGLASNPKKKEKSVYWPAYRRNFVNGFGKHVGHTDIGSVKVGVRCDAKCKPQPFGFAYLSKAARTGRGLNGAAMTFDCDFDHIQVVSGNTAKYVGRTGCSMRNVFGARFDLDVKGVGLGVDLKLDYKGSVEQNGGAYVDSCAKF